MSPLPDADPVGPRGPLEGIRVIEIASIGPIPFCGMVLSDMGADVVRVDRAVDAAAANANTNTMGGGVLDRGRRSIGIDLKHPRGVEVVLELVKSADVLIEGFRPGVAERLGIGPTDCLAKNARLVYGRMTGWGREGPLADRVGHDIDYIAIAGALHTFGRAGGPPTPPLSIIGDLAGGGMLLAYGITCALISSARTGMGQVVDTAMVDGIALLMGPWYAAQQAGTWRDERGANTLDSGAPYYDTYECADGRFVAVGAIESRFYDALLEGLGLRRADLPDRDDPAQWEELRSIFAERFRTRSRDEWADHFESRDACVAPVLSLAEAPAHAHNRARDVFVTVDGVRHPSPAPRFSATPGAIAGRGCHPGQHTDEILESVGYRRDDREALRAAGAVV